MANNLEGFEETNPSTFIVVTGGQYEHCAMETFPEYPTKGSTWMDLPIVWWFVDNYCSL